VDSSLNEKPFVHRSSHGTCFKAKRCDFVGGVIALVPKSLTPEQMMEDAAEMGAWHWANIVPQLNGFTGPAKIRTFSETLDEHERKEAILLMPPMEFFSLESLRALTPSRTLATRTYNCLNWDCNPNWQNSEGVILSLEEFLQIKTTNYLLRTPNLGKKGVELIKLRLKSENLALDK
jgi:hypothetical protein